MLILTIFFRLGWSLYLLYLNLLINSALIRWVLPLRFFILFDQVLKVACIVLLIVLPTVCILRFGLVWEIGGSGLAITQLMMLFYVYGLLVSQICWILNRLLMCSCSQLCSFSHIEVHLVSCIILAHIFGCVQNLCLFLCLITLTNRLLLNWLILLMGFFSIATRWLISYRLLLQLQDITWLRSAWHCLWGSNVLKIIFLTTFSNICAYASWFLSYDFAFDVWAYVLVNYVNLIHVDICWFSNISWQCQLLH